MQRSFVSVFATCVAASLLAACPPPATTTPAPEAEAEAQAEIQSAPQSRPESSKGNPAASRREQRRAASAAAPPSGQYKYVDERGNLRLAARLEDIPERQRSTATALELPPARTRPQFDEDRVIQTADITIYTTRSCGYCRAAMAHFDKRGLEYVNRDVEADEEARAEYLELTSGRRGVPVIVVGESWIQGWSQPEFDRLLASAR